MFSAVTCDPLVPSRAFQTLVICSPAGSGQVTAQPSTPVLPAVTTTCPWNQFWLSDVQWLVTVYTAVHAVAGIGSGGATPPSVGLGTAGVGATVGCARGVADGVGVG